MRATLSLDPEACNGNAMCALESPLLFAMDDETGRGVAKTTHVDETLLPQAEAAVRACPAQAISVEEER